MEAIKKRGFTVKEVASAVGLSVRTLHNLASTNCKNRSARQRLSNFLCITIWPEHPADTAMVTFPENVHVTIFGVSEQKAVELHEEFPDSTEISGGTVVLSKPVPLIFDFRHARLAQKASVEKRRRSAIPS
jgi:lambda repressor-like predicted transcriptional regulator